MNPTILIPIDLKIASLNTLRLALEKGEDEAVNVVLLYAEFLDDSISDLLFYSPRTFLESRVNPEFHEAISVIKNRFEKKIKSIDIELFHGYNLNALKNFLDGRKIDHIYLPATYQLHRNGKHPDIVRMLRKCKISRHEMNWTVKNDQTEFDQLISLFQY